MTPDEAITIVTTVCAIPSHPFTGIIDTVYASVRNQLPQAKWLFLFDGVHDIQRDMLTGYEEYKKILTARIDNGRWPNAEYKIFPEWHHQAGMVRESIGLIRTPLILWIEHDYLFNGLPIEWPGIVNSLMDGEICYLRFALPEEDWITIRNLHEPMPTISRFNVPMMRTLNYSGLPHVCSVDFIRRLMCEFTEARSFLECIRTENIARQEENLRLALYTPPGYLARVYTLDGREGHKKPEMVF